MKKAGAIGMVAESLPENKIIIKSCLESNRYILLWIYLTNSENTNKSGRKRMGRAARFGVGGDAVVTGLLRK